MSTTSTSPPPTGSVAATDGSTISWTTAKNGIVTVSSTNGACLVQVPSVAQKTANIVQTESIYYQNGSAPYLTIDMAIDLNSNLFRLRWVTPTAQINLDVNLPKDEASIANPCVATLSGTVNGDSIQWTDTVPPSTLADPQQLAGWPSGALANELGRISCFAPYFGVVAQTPPPPLPTPGKPPTLIPISEPVQKGGVTHPTTPRPIARPMTTSYPGPGWWAGALSIAGSWLSLLQKTDSTLIGSLTSGPYIGETYLGTDTAVAMVGGLWTVAGVAISWDAYLLITGNLPDWLTTSGPTWTPQPDPSSSPSNLVCSPVASDPSQAQSYDPSSNQSTDPGQSTSNQSTSSDPGSNQSSQPGSTQSTDPGNSQSTDPGNNQSTDPGDNQSTDPGDDGGGGGGPSNGDSSAFPGGKAPPKGGKLQTM